MSASLLHIPPTPASRRRFEISREHANRKFNFLGKYGLLGETGLRKCHLVLRCACWEGFLSPKLRGIHRERSKMLNEAYSGINGDNDFQRQLQDFFVEIKMALEKGTNDDAIDLLQANYELVKDQIKDGFEGIEQAAILDIIALGYMGIGDFKLVEQLLDMLDGIVGALHDDTPLMDSLLLHMGGMFTALDKFEDAALLYERSLKILEQGFGSDSPYLIPPLMGLAKVFGSNGKTRNALAVYHRAIDILEKKRGVESKELVVPLIGLGNTLIRAGKATESEACFSRILEIHKQVYGENDGRTGMAMCSFAHALCAKGGVDEAISMYKSGLQIIKDTKYIDWEDDILEKMRIDLAELLHVTGREQEGRELLRECLLITERYRGIEHPISVVHLLNLATSYSRSKNFVEAERLLRTCLQIMSKMVGPKDQALTVPMLHLAVVLYHQKQDEEAESLALEAVRIREHSLGVESIPVGEALDCLVSIQARLGKDTNEVLERLKRILSIQEKELGYESEEVMATLKKIVFYLDKSGKRDEGFPFQRRLSVLRNKHKQKITL